MRIRSQASRPAPAMSCVGSRAATRPLRRPRLPGGRARGPSYSAAARALHGGLAELPRPSLSAHTQLTLRYPGHRETA